MKLAAAIAAILAGAALIGCAVDQAFGHDAPSGWSYSSVCCGGNDCAPVPQSAIQLTPEGVVVTLRPGDHPMVTREHRWVVQGGGKVGQTEIDQVGRSGDEHHHVCLYPNEYTLRCVYLAEGGV